MLFKFGYSDIRGASQPCCLNSYTYPLLTLKKRPSILGRQAGVFLYTLSYTVMKKVGSIESRGGVGGV